MTVTVEQTVEARVAAGAEWLDDYAEDHPELRDWQSRINPYSLDLHAVQFCILGQLYGVVKHESKPVYMWYWWWRFEPGGPQLSREFAQSHGFAGNYGSGLTEAWKRLLTERRAG